MCLAPWEQWLRVGMRAGLGTSARSIQKSRQDEGSWLQSSAGPLPGGGSSVPSVGARAGGGGRGKGGEGLLMGEGAQKEGGSG